MGKTYEELLKELTPERRKRVEARGAELIAEEKSLRDLRQARRLTQQRMAKMLGVKQHSISRLEQRSDMLLSTLREYIYKMGGVLEIVARFPDREPVRITGFKDIGAGRGTRPSRRTRHASTARSRRAPQILASEYTAPPKGKGRPGRPTS